MQRRFDVVISLTVMVIAAAFARLASAAEPADLVLLGGKIVTVDRDRPQAQALASRAEQIVAVGSDEQISQFIGPQTRVIQLAGRLAIPGPFCA